LKKFTSRAAQAFGSGFPDRFMDNCSIYLRPEIFQFRSEKSMKLANFPPHSSRPVQILDLVFVSPIEHPKKRLPKDPGISIMEDHAKRTRKPREPADANRTAKAPC
jgi:hypothetical protein